MFHDVFTYWPIITDHFSRSYENHSNGSILRNYDKDWKSLKGELHLKCSNKTAN